MRLRGLLLASSFLFAACGSNAALANILVTVDKSTQTMTVAKDGQVVHQWPVSTGRRGYDTPNGTFRAFRMEKDHFSKEWDDAPMPNSIFFTKVGHAIHGYLDTKNIGRPASHGCVRLSPDHAKVLYAMVEKDGVLNTTVTLTGQIPAGAPAVARREAPAQANNGAPMPINPNAQPNYDNNWQGYRQPGEYQPNYQQRQQPYPQQGYAQPYDQRQQQYGQNYGPQYNQPTYNQPRYPQQGYGQPRYDPRYSQQYDDDDAPPPPTYYRPRGFFQPWN